MGDEFDGCECVWSHEFAMQRLLAMIRQSQNHCSDTECIDVSGRVRDASTTGNDGNEDGNFTMMTTMLMLFAVLMYLIRPDSIMKLTNTKHRSQRRQDPDNGLPPPPPPPPAIN